MATERTTERQQTMSATTGGTATQQEQITGPAKGTPQEITSHLQDLIAGVKVGGNTSVMADAVWIANQLSDMTGQFYTADGLPKDIYQGRRTTDRHGVPGFNLAEARAHTSNLATALDKLTSLKLAGDAGRQVQALASDCAWFEQAFGT